MQIEYELNSDEDQGNVAQTTEKGNTTTEKTESTTENATEKDDVTTEKILSLLRNNSSLTTKDLAAACGITDDGVFWHIKKLKEKGRIMRIGGRKKGHWEVIK